jgi:hypothetical protein
MYTPINLKYLYPQRYGYRKSALAYSFPVPLYSRSRSYATGLEGILYQRQEVIDAMIKMIISEIDQRRILKDETIHQNGLDQCTCRGMIYELKQRYVDRRVVDLEKKMIVLEQENARNNPATSAISCSSEKSSRKQSSKSSKKNKKRRCSETRQR